MAAPKEPAVVAGLADSEDTIPNIYDMSSLTDTEKKLIPKAARTHVQALIAAQTLQGNADGYVPTAKPQWD